MSRIPVFLIAVVLLLACESVKQPPTTSPSLPSQQPVSQTPARLDVLADTLAEAINTGKAEAFVAAYGKPMLDAFPLEATADFLAKVRQAKGAVQNVVPPDAVRSATYCLRTEQGDWNALLTINAAGELIGLSITEAEPADVPVERSAALLHLPFDEPVSVAWGGDTMENNQHLVSPPQRRAADLLILDESGKTHRGDGKTNEDYYIFGKTVLATAPGDVLGAVDGIPDNEPRKKSKFMALGNYVLIRHAEKEYALYAHLKKGSVRVKEGQVVKAGDPLGLCGNSGHSSEAHLHFHLQDHPIMEDALGIEPVFTGVLLQRNGVSSNPENYTFLRGDVVQPRKP